MFRAPYFQDDGSRNGDRALPPDLFDGVVNENAVHAAVKAYLANQRRGTGAAKGRSAVRGGSRKPWRQKGTGRARQGTIRAPQWSGGGVAFPPIPRSWNKRISRKLKALARRSALNDRAKHERVLLADLPRLERPHTRTLVDYLDAIKTQGKVLVLTDQVNRQVYLSGRNLSFVTVKPFGGESTYDIVWAQTVVIEKSALSLPEESADA